MNFGFSNQTFIYILFFLCYRLNIKYYFERWQSIMQQTSIRLQIKSIYRDLSPKEKSIADYILKDPKLVSRSTINEISGQLNIADSTFFQFTRKLGYSGFKDFKIALLTDEFDATISIHENISKSDDEVSIAQKVFDSSIQALEDTKKLINKTSYVNAAKIILDSGVVKFFGLGGSTVVAQDTYHKFLRSPIKCEYVADFHMQLMQASLLTKNDCAFVISHTGITKEAIDIAKIAKQNEAKLIVVTSYPLSTLAKMADVVFISTAEETSYRSEALSSRLSQLAIIDALFVIVMFHDEAKSNHSLQKIRSVISQTKDSD